MIERMRDMVHDGQSFAFETTCAGKSYIRLLKECQKAGWRVSLIYLWVPSPEYSIARVARRVRQGGHYIPDEVIRRRYQTGLWNMRNLYLPQADDATIYDNKKQGLAADCAARPWFSSQCVGRGDLGKDRGGDPMSTMTVQEIFDAIDSGMAEVSRRLASGELDQSGRYYTDEELAAHAATGAERAPAKAVKATAA